MKVSNVKSSFVPLQWKHGLHCLAFLTVIFLIQLRSFLAVKEVSDPWETYGTVWTLVLYTLSMVPLIHVPRAICTFLGLTLYDSFSDTVQLISESMVDAPFVCLRMVTRGDYPKLVEENVRLNLQACESLGMLHYRLEVVSEKHLELPIHPKMRLLVVPSTYRTRNGTLFKARNLQYCLEDRHNLLRDQDWILHLDEDSVVTENCLKGVLNFARENRHPFGQGYVELDPDDRSVWPTNLLNSSRMLMDLGFGKFQFKYWNNCFFGWKGSFMLCKASAEMDVSFDGGPLGSVTENAFFAMTATQKGYSFGWVDGTMVEIGPLGATDFARQSFRILQGVYLCLQGKFTFRTKFSMYLFLLALLSAPVALLGILANELCPLPGSYWLCFTQNFVIAVDLYGFVFWALKRCRSGRIMRVFLELTSGLTLGYFFRLFVANVVAIQWLFLQRGPSDFKVTPKEIKRRKSSSKQYAHLQ